MVIFIQYNCQNVICKNVVHVVLIFCLFYLFLFIVFVTNLSPYIYLKDFVVFIFTNSSKFISVKCVFVFLPLYFSFKNHLQI